MPGPLHGGILYARPWYPGAGAAGVPQRTEIGTFSEDMVLVGIYRDYDYAGAVDAIARCYVGKSGSGSKYNVIEPTYSSSNLFDADLAGGRIELGVFIPAGEKVVFEVAHTGTTKIDWLFLVAPPPVTREGVAKVIDALMTGRGPTAPAKGPTQFSK